MTSTNETTNRLSFEGMENDAINWFPKPNTEYTITRNWTHKPYAFLGLGSTLGRQVLTPFFQDTKTPYTMIDHSGEYLIDNTPGSFEKVYLNAAQINGVVFPEQDISVTGEPDVHRQVVLAWYARASHRQLGICPEIQNLHADVLNTALPFDLVEKYFVSYKPKACSPDGMLHFWIRTIVTRRQDTQTLMDVCREIIALDGAILGQACYDVENKIIYRYVRDDKTPFRAWQSIGVEIPSDDPINLQNWPRKERVGLRSGSMCYGTIVSSGAWNVPEFSRLLTWTKVTDRSHGYLMYQCLNSHCRPCCTGVGQWMSDTDLECKNILEKTPIADRVVECFSSVANEKNGKSSVVSCTCAHTVPQPDPKLTPPGIPRHVLTNSTIGFARPLRNRVVSQQPPLVVKRPNTSVTSVRFKAYIRLRGSNCNPMSSEWSIDCSKTGTNLRGVLHYLKAWSDGSYFHATAAMDGQMEYSLSDMTIIWRNLDEIGNSPSPGSTETGVILKSGMENDDGIVAFEKITKKTDIDLFYRRIDYLISELQKLV